MVMRPVADREAIEDVRRRRRDVRKAGRAGHTSRTFDLPDDVPPVGETQGPPTGRR